MQKKLKGTTPLERFVAKSMNEKAGNYDNGLEGVLNDLMYGGCQSGYVGELVYYDDTCKFYKKYRDEINAILQGSLADISRSGSPVDLFGDKWEVTDPLALDTQNQNLLAWFGYEETALRMCRDIGIEF